MSSRLRYSTWFGFFHIRLHYGDRSIAVWYHASQSRKFTQHKFNRNKFLDFAADFSYVTYELQHWKAACSPIHVTYPITAPHGQTQNLPILKSEKTRKIKVIIIKWMTNVLKMFFKWLLKFKWSEFSQLLMIIVPDSESKFLDKRSKQFVLSHFRLSLSSICVNFRLLIDNFEVFNSHFFKMFNHWSFQFQLSTINLWILSKR